MEETGAFKAEGMEYAESQSRKQRGLRQKTKPRLVSTEGRRESPLSGKGVVWPDLVFQVPLSAAWRAVWEKARPEAVRTNPAVQVKDDMSLTLEKSGQLKEIFERPHQALRSWVTSP